MARNDLGTSAQAVRRMLEPGSNTRQKGPAQNWDAWMNPRLCRNERAPMKGLKGRITAGLLHASGLRCSFRVLHRNMKAVRLVQKGW